MKKMILVAMMIAMMFSLTGCFSTSDENDEPLVGGEETIIYETIEYENVIYETIEVEE